MKVIQNFWINLIKNESFVLFSPLCLYLFYASIIFLSLHIYF